MEQDPRDFMKGAGVACLMATAGGMGHVAAHELNARAEAMGDPAREENHHAQSAHLLYARHPRRQKRLAGWPKG
jgi:hypothetical protein